MLISRPPLTALSAASFLRPEEANSPWTGQGTLYFWRVLLWQEVGRRRPQGETGHKHRQPHRLRGLRGLRSRPGGRDVWYVKHGDDGCCCIIMILLFYSQVTNKKSVCMRPHVLFLLPDITTETVYMSPKKRPPGYRCFSGFLPQDVLSWFFQIFTVSANIWIITN